MQTATIRECSGYTNIQRNGLQNKKNVTRDKEL